MAVIEIDIDTKSFERRLGEHKNKMPSIARKMMNKVNTKIKQDSRSVMRSRHYNTSKEDGVYKNLFSKGNKDFTAVVGIKRFSGSVYYAPFIKYGAHIVAKNNEYLCFQVNGKFVKVKEVTVAPKPFMEDLIKSYWNTDKAREIMEAVFQKELKKIYDKDNSK